MGCDQPNVGLNQMGSPVIPDQFCDAVPANNADFCTRFTKFLNVPQLLCDLFNWMLTPTGTISDEFKAEVATYSTPTGTIIYTLSTNVGAGWLRCDGTAVSRTTYAALFAEIGTRYGAGDGSTTFNLPDIRGRSPIGAGSGSGLTNHDINSKYVGEESHTQTASEVGIHQHDIIAKLSADLSGGNAGAVVNNPSGAVYTAHTEDSTGGQPFNVIHPCVIAYAWVKT